VVKAWQAAVMTEAPALTESALVVLVPEAEPAVSTWRSKLDPSAALGVPAHVTLLYPFVEPTGIDDTVLSTVARAIGVSRPFEFALDDVRWFGDTVMWLAPSPPEPFIVLTQALVDAFPNCPRYGGSVGDEIVPHLTVADGAPLARSRRAARAVLEALPIRARAHAVALLVGGRSPGSWRVARNLKLG
jgi:2'-5' RNA ligase